MNQRKFDTDGEQSGRVRRICASLPGTSEKLSGRTHLLCAQQGFCHVCEQSPQRQTYCRLDSCTVWLTSRADKHSPEKFFKPPSVGVCGWVGIELDGVSDEELAYYVCEAWRLIAPKKVQTASEQSFAR